MVDNSHLGKILTLIGDGEIVELVPHIVFASSIKTIKLEEEHADEKLKAQIA